MKGRITISKPSSNCAPYKWISINIQDDSSGTHILEVKMTLEDFAQAITGLGNCDCDIATLVNEKGFRHIGKIREHKTVHVNKPDTYIKEEQERLVEQSVEDDGHLVDGWHISNNGVHRQQPGNKHCVSLCRYVGRCGNE